MQIAASAEGAASNRKVRHLIGQSVSAVDTERCNPRSAEGAASNRAVRKGCYTDWS